jgi:hypothetical protein
MMECAKFRVDDHTKPGLRSIAQNNKLWTNDTITVSFVGPPHETMIPANNINPLENFAQANVPVNVPDYIKAVIRERIQPLIGLKISYDYNYVANIRINWGPRADGCWSYVGTDNLAQPAEQPTMEFQWIDTGTVTHEFMHALGFEHEHQNPYNNTLEFDYAALDELQVQIGWSNSDIETNITNKITDENVTASDMDFESIMMYPLNDYIVSSEHVIPNNTKLSIGDMIGLITCYPGGEVGDVTAFHTLIYPTEPTNDKTTELNNEQTTEQLNNEQTTEQLNNEQTTELNNEQTTELNNEQTTEQLNNEQTTELNNEQPTYLKGESSNRIRMLHYGLVFMSILTCILVYFIIKRNIHIKKNNISVVQ